MSNITLKLAKERTAWRDITIEGGAYDGVTIRAKYRLMGREEMAERILQVQEQSGGKDPGAILRDSLSQERRDEQDALLADHILDLEGIGDEAGNPLSCDDATLQALFDAPEIRRALDNGLWAASRGEPAKN